MTDIRLRVNGRVIHQCSAVDLDAMNAFTGMVTDPNLLTLDLTEIFARDAIGQKIGALSTAAGVSAVALEIDIAGTAVVPTRFLNTTGRDDAYLTKQ